MSLIEDNLNKVLSTLPQGVRLVAGSKFHPADMVREAYDAGQRLFGENRPQELKEKYALLPKDIEWHMIGHLQTNKVKFVVGKVDMIESVDSVKLAREIEKRCAAIGKTMEFLLEVNIAGEESKSGFDYDEIPAAVEEIGKMSHLKLRGFMTIGRFGAEIEETRGYFQKMRALLVDIGSEKIHNKDISILSMGMSGDYEVAVQEGAAIVRVGRGLFGERKSVM